MSAEDVATAFVNHYYQTFDANPSQLHALFQPSTMMTFEGQQFQGPDAIVGKLSGIGKVAHSVKSTDVQPSCQSNAILIFVTGSIKIGDENANPLHFSELFQLVSSGPGQYYVHNCVFRLNYGL